MVVADNGSHPQREPQGRNEEHVARAQRAIALVTAFNDVSQRGAMPAARLLHDLMAEDSHPELLLASVCALAAALVDDLAAATGTTPQARLSALGAAAALLA